MSEKLIPSAPAGYVDAPPPYQATMESANLTTGMNPQPAGQTIYVPSSPPAGYRPPPISATTTTVVITDSGFYGRNPVTTQCPNCQSNVLSETKTKPGTLTWILCGVIALFGGIFGCCLVPFCVDNVKDVEHRCPQCKAHLGTYHIIRDSRRRHH